MNSLSSTIKDGSDYVYEYCCDLCEEEGQHREAVGYCSDCREYLCTDCVSHHTRPKPMRHHILLDQLRMPKYKQQTGGTESLSSTLKGGSDYVYEFCCDLCEGEGQLREAVGYCSDCREYLCTDCFNHHTKPKPMRNHVLLDQHQMPKEQQHTGGTDSLSSTLKGGSDYVYEYCCDLCEGEGQHREAVGYCSDCREYLCAECFSHHTRPKPSRHHVLLDQQQMSKNNQASASRQVSEVEARVSRVPLQQDRDVRKTRAQHVMDVYVRSAGYNTMPIITGCVVLPGDKLVFVDWLNGNVHLADLTLGDVVSQLELCKGIWDTTQVSRTQVAVTSPGEETIYVVKVRFQILNMRDKLKLERKFKVDGLCHGIARIGDNLVVSCAEPVKVEIVSMKGQVLQTVVTEDKGKQLFTYPYYIAVSKDQQTVYISDLTRRTVTSVDLTGRVQATYKHDKLDQTLGLTVDTTGTVYACGQLSHNVLQLTADLAEERQLLKRSCGVKYPQSVCYCEATDRLCVGMRDSDVVKVFQMK